MGMVLHGFANSLRDLISPQGTFWVREAARCDAKGNVELVGMYANLQKLRRKYNERIRQEHPHSGVLTMRFSVEKQLGDFDRIRWGMEQRLNDELVRRLRSERGEMKKQRDDMKRERDCMQKERDGMQKERNDMKKERDDAMESLMKEMEEQAKKLKLEVENEESHGSGYHSEFEKLRATVNEVNQEVNTMTNAHNEVIRQLSEMRSGKDTETKLRQVQATEKDKSEQKFAQDLENAKKHVRTLQRRENDLKARLVGQEGLIKGLRLCIGNTRDLN